ncbi:NifU-like scaffold protein, putative (NifU) [Plasmodium ovale wallikeri]|uniref:NifU-like scaffold protein, putative (NifU) n=1 Tax=Plasmodium ovale wallikeri TaxID=864142 RepID=A0A1A8YQ40_PLAOA|nr:NifU-like scaffold protein, putative (NifU) [Plasmodium ovale wallikeri]SBT33979.1 NifU-like scaffold protein, putative (NifU) [Plasmodium ovale wallikeri]
MRERGKNTASARAKLRSQVEVVIKNLINNKENIKNSVLLMFRNIDNEGEEVKVPFHVKSEITERLRQKFPSLTVNFEN